MPRSPTTPDVPIVVNTGCGIACCGSSMRWQALEAARFLSQSPTIARQIASAEVLLPAIRRWSANPLFRGHAEKVLGYACMEARTAQEAIELAERAFRFLTADEAVPPAAGGV